MTTDKRTTNVRIMSIFDQYIEGFKGTEDRLLSTKEIVEVLNQRYGTNTSSIRPADFCYNRWNKSVGMRQQAVFVRIGHGEYRFLGPDAPYSGLVYARSTAANQKYDHVVGERIDGALKLYGIDTYVTSSRQESTSALAGLETLPLSPRQLDRLYEQYMEILTLEVGEFGCKPTETRHLIGRLGELYCARTTQGQLARKVNQAGFDVVGGDGRRISVKTTAQKAGFIAMNERTINLADDLMVLRFKDFDFEVLFHGESRLAVDAARRWRGSLELDLGRARSLCASNP